MPLTTPFNLVSSELARQSHWMTAGPFQLKYSVLFNYSLRCAQFTAISPCNWRGQWCSKSRIPALSTSTHRGEQRGLFNGNDLTEDSHLCNHLLLLPAPLWAVLPCSSGTTALWDVQNCTLQEHLSLWSMHTTESKKGLSDREQINRSYCQDVPAPAALKHNIAPIPLLRCAHAGMDSWAPALARFRNYLS